MNDWKFKASDFQQIFTFFDGERAAEIANQILAEERAKVPDKQRYASTREQKLDFIRKNEALWNNSTQMLFKMVEARLYSKTTNWQDVQMTVERMIEEVKNEHKV